MAWLAQDSVADAGAFLARVVRLDPEAVVRLRPQGPGTVALWARLPFGVLVSRGVRSEHPDDVTVSAAALLATLNAPDLPVAGLPASRPADWQWPLPKVPGTVVESIPAEDVLRVGEAAADTVRSASAEGVGGRAVGSRALRDALLDHVPIVVTTVTGERVSVPQRLVQAALRMGFAPAGSLVEVRVAGGWVGLSASYGNSWFRPPLLLR